MEQAQQQQGNQGHTKLPPGVLQHYNKLKAEYSELFRASLDLEEEKKEHQLVLEAIKDLEPERKCWRLVGGVLVEKKLNEVTVSLKEGEEMIGNTHQNYQKTLKEKEKALIEFEVKYNLRPNRDPNQSQPQQQQPKEGQKTSLLA